jgi:hypothetical protein
VEGAIRLDRLDVLRRDHEIALAVHGLENDRRLGDRLDLALEHGALHRHAIRVRGNGNQQGEDDENGVARRVHAMFSRVEGGGR